MKRSIAIYLLILSSNITLAQSVITGTVTNTKGETIPFASVLINKTTQGVSADEHGKYQLKTARTGKITLSASSTGFITLNRAITVTKSNNTYTQNFTLKEFSEVLNEITVTGTRTNKRSTDNPVIVNVINSATLANVQACNLSEGLKFQKSKLVTR